jgi:hypothetical protein
MPGTNVPPDVVGALRSLQQRVEDLERKIGQRSDLSTQASGDGHTHKGYPSHIVMVKDSINNLEGATGALDLSTRGVILTTLHNQLASLNMDNTGGNGVVTLFAFTNLILQLDAGFGKLGFFDATTGAIKQTVTGSRGGNAALASLLTSLAAYDLIIDSTTA